MQNVFWVAASALILIGVQIILLGHFSVSRVTYRRYFTKSKLFEGEEMEMVEIIANNKLLPAPWILVESRVPKELSIVGAKQDLDVEGELYHRSAFTLSPFQQITRRHRVKCVSRGHYRATSAVLTGGDLLGIYKQTANAQLESSVTVYPAPINAQNIPLPSLKWQGDLIVKRYILPDVFIYGGIRDYAMGDPMKSIHWGASAATGSLKVKQFDFTASPKLLMILNTQPAENVWGEIPMADRPLIEEGIRVATSIALHLLNSGVEVGFATNGAMIDSKEDVFISPSCSYEQREVLLDCFAKLRVTRKHSFHQFLADLPPFKEHDVLLITCYRSQLLDDICADIALRGNSIDYYMLKEDA